MKTKKRVINKNKSMKKRGGAFFNSTKSHVIISSEDMAVLSDISEETTAELIKKYEDMMDNITDKLFVHYDGPWRHFRGLNSESMTQTQKNLKNNLYVFRNIIMDSQLTLYELNMKLNHSTRKLSDKEKDILRYFIDKKKFGLNVNTVPTQRSIFNRIRWR